MVSFIGQNNNISFVYLASAMGMVCGKATFIVQCLNAFSLNAGWINLNSCLNKRKTVA